MLSKQLVLIEMPSNQDKKRENILHFLVENPGVSNKIISKVFQIALRTVQSIVKQFKDTGYNQKSGSGRKKGFVQQDFVKKVKDALDRNPELSVRTLVNKFKTNASTIQRVKRNCGYKSYKKKKVPCHEEKQENVAICHSKLLYKKLCDKKSCLIIDNETYCAAYFRSLPGHQYYSAINCKKLNSKYKCFGMQKFTKKFLVWQVICECGERNSCFVTTRTINTKIYIKECLKERF